ncbi:MAG TPA: hypothetical protein VFT74_13840 [Isosphaeraceae bacterium]|nr:hypothetical protein [Isosphaeraceae bacterium]
MNPEFNSVRSMNEAVVAINGQGDLVRDGLVDPRLRVHYRTPSRPEAGFNDSDRGDWTSRRLHLSEMGLEMSAYLAVHYPRTVLVAFVTVQAMIFSRLSA